MKIIEKTDRKFKKDYYKILFMLLIIILKLINKNIYKLPVSDKI
jgi:hypothetical protein